MKFDNKEDFLSFIKKSLEDGDFDSQIKRFAQEIKYNDGLGIHTRREWVSISYPNESFDEDTGTYKNWDWIEFGKTYLVTNGSNYPISQHSKQFLDIEDFAQDGVKQGSIPSLFFIYYGNQEGSFMWVGFDSPTSLNSNFWDMNSNGGECWVTNYLELKLENNSFLNWDKEPWGDAK